MIAETIKEYRAEFVTGVLAIAEWINMEMVNDYLMGLAIVLLIIYRIFKICKLKRKQ